MKNFLKHRPTFLRTFSFFMAIFFVAITAATLVHAQGSIADVCGQTATQAKCTVADLGKVLWGIMKLIITVGTPLLIVFISIRFIIQFFLLIQGKAKDYHDAYKKSGEAIVAFLILTALLGGIMYVMLRYVGIQEGPLKILRSIISDAFFTHAYAQGITPTGGSPFNLTSSRDIWDFLLSMARLVMRFFVYPGLIIAWVWTGFAFVMAQGAPDALTKAKKYLMGAFISTFIIFMLQTLLIAAQGTVNKILPGAGGQQTTTQTTGGKVDMTDGRVAPTPGAINSECTTSSGASGVMGAYNVCYVGRGAGSSNSADYCLDKDINTLCTITEGGVNKTGTCLVKDGTAKSCYLAPQGSICITTGSVYGAIDAKGNCDPGQRPNVGKGGSCRISAECSGGGALLCKNGTCQ